jgi:hypothetical protein
MVRRQADPGVYILPGGAELVLGTIRSTFTCHQRIYGYYADVDNDCRVFHVCVPQVLADGTQETAMFSFFCGNQTVFDQEQLVCNHEVDAVPCDQAESFYRINEFFGRIEEQQVTPSTQSPISQEVFTTTSRSVSQTTEKSVSLRRKSLLVDNK